MSQYEPNDFAEGVGIITGNGFRILFGLIVVIVVAVIAWPLAIPVAVVLLILFGRGEEKRRARRAERKGGQP